MTRRARPARRGRGALSLAAAVLVFLPAIAAGRSREDRPPSPELRRVFVTDSRCGAEGARRGDHRRCALECSSRGHALVLYDAKRGALYRILYGSEELRYKVLNDHAGLEVMARGIWDDAEGIVRLQDIFPAVDERAGPLEDLDP